MRLCVVDVVQTALQRGVWVERFAIQRRHGEVHHAKLEVAIKGAENLVFEHLDGEAGRLGQPLLESFYGTFLIYAPWCVSVYYPDACRRWIPSTYDDTTVLCPEE